MSKAILQYPYKLLFDSYIKNFFAKKRPVKVSCKTSGSLIIINSKESNSSVLCNYFKMANNSQKIHLYEIPYIDSSSEREICLTLTIENAAYTTRDVGFIILASYDKLFSEEYIIFFFLSEFVSLISQFLKEM